VYLFYHFTINYVKYLGPIAEWISGPQANTIVSFKEQTYELPLVHSNPDCKYLLLTEPLRNSYNILAQGDSLLLRK